MTDETFILNPGQLSLSDLPALIADERPVALAAGARAAVDAAAETVAAIAREGKSVYGVNTGFGSLASTAIPPDQVHELQRRLLLSHSAGTGPLLRDDVVRLVLLLKINSLARGHSGVRWSLVEALLSLLNAGVYPCIPAKGSVGASGDLAPLAHLGATLIGAGEVRIDGQVRPAAEGLKRAGLEPVSLEAKEGLALVNGTQVSTAMLVSALITVDTVLAAALVAGALSADAVQGSDVPFDARLHDVGGHSGQREVARVLRGLIQGSAIRASHLTCDRVQDPYSIRCQPQVMGACLDVIRFVAKTAEHEANAVSDNPLVFPETGDILSGGNFHGEPVALAADMLAIALAEVGSLSERRIALLMDAHLSGLPAFLVAAPGLNSGFMAAQITAAALASENKALAHPASIDSLPTSANQEDHVSMSAYAARRLSDMLDNAAAIVAIELLAGAQGVELRKPLVTSPPLQEAMEVIRSRVPFLDSDREPAPDMAAAKDLVTGGRLRSLVPVAIVLRGMVGLTGRGLADRKRSGSQAAD